jgi:hypothetical protein
MNHFQFGAARPSPDFGTDRPGHDRLNEDDQAKPGSGSQASPSNAGTEIAATIAGEWLSVADAVAYCADKGLSRNIKTVRRWAHRSFAHPETAEVLAQKQDTETDFRYVIERHSLDVKIAQELGFEAQARPDSSGHDRPGPDTPGDVVERTDFDLPQRTGVDVSANDRAGEDMRGDARQASAASDDAATRLAGDDPFLKEQITEKDRQIGRLHQQLERRDEQIMAMLERDRETNILIKGLQEALLPTSASDDGRVRRLKVHSGRYQREVDKPGDDDVGDGVY